SVAPSQPSPVIVVPPATPVRVAPSTVTVPAPLATNSLTGGPAGAWTFHVETPLTMRTGTVPSGAGSASSMLVAPPTSSTSPTRPAARSTVSVVAPPTRRTRQRVAVASSISTVDG